MPPPPPKLAISRGFVSPWGWFPTLGNFRAALRAILPLAPVFAVFGLVPVQAQKASNGPTSEASFGHLEAPHDYSVLHIQRTDLVGLAASI